MIAGMQWIYDNRATYNIRVVSISLTDSVVESYHVSLLAAAAELLWFNNIVVVAQLVIPVRTRFQRQPTILLSSQSVLPTIVVLPARRCADATACCLAMNSCQMR
jgi:hypothetical protein